MLRIGLSVAALVGVVIGTFPSVSEARTWHTGIAGSVGSGSNTMA